MGTELSNMSNMLESHFDLVREHDDHRTRPSLVRKPLKLQRESTPIGFRNCIIYVYGKLLMTPNRFLLHVALLK